jgi:hypothetical protein
VVSITVRVRNSANDVRVLESVKIGKRQAEAPFVDLKIAAKWQRSVYGMFKKPGSSGEV